MKRAAYLTPAEFELMEILWSGGEASVRQVWEKVRPRRSVAYTTVMTVLFKMHRKGMLSQRKQGKAYFYAPVIDRNQALENVVEGILGAYFHGSPDELLRFIPKDGARTGVESHGTPSDNNPASSMDEFLL